MEIQSITEAKKRVESLERVNDIINAMDKDDLVARTLLDTETYDKVYKHYLAQIQTAAKGTKAMNAAKDSALILAKIAENLKKNYGIPLEKSLAEINGGDTVADKTLGQYMSPEDQLKIDARYFMDQVNKALAGDLKSEYIRVMRTPLIMKLIGAKILPITLSANKLKLVLSNHSESINKEFLRQIPEALADPMMVFKTYNGKNGETRKVFVIDVKDKHGATVVIPVELDTKTGEYHVNRITSIYGKNDGKSGNPKYKFFKANIERGNVEYVNKKKTAAWYSSEEVYSSIPKEAMSSLLNSNLPNENDLVKLKEESPTYYQMAGGHAINAPINKLVEAGRMRDEGETPEEIWNKTGWMIGPDHMWRFEIPDNLDKIRIPKDNGKFALSEIYDNPALYEAYPELANRQVSFKDIKKTEGGDVRGANGYVNANGEISIDSSLSEEEAKSTLVHEIQHTIQSIEGFSEGGSPNRAKKTIQDQIDDLIAKISEMESESKDVFDYIGKALQLEEELNNYSDDDAIGWIKRTKKLKEEKEKMFKELPISKEKKEKLENLERDIDLLKSALSQDDYAAYRRLGGEAEAFMTEGRAYSQTDRQRDIEYNKRAQQRKARFEKLKKTIPSEELIKLEAIGKLEKEIEEYRKQPDHDLNRLIKMIEKSTKLVKEIPVQHYIDYESAALADKPTVPKELPIPNYNTSYGPAVINFAGDFYPLSTSTPDLVVYHNVNERNLESAISLGGLPMPSLAITKKDMDFGDFGDITLIGDKNMVDPRRSRDNEVFSRDAYTVRKPIVNYEQPSEAAQEDFRKKYSTAQKELKRQGMDVRDIDFSAYDGDQIITRFKRDPAVRYYYVKKILGKDVTVKRKTVYPEIRHNSFFESYPEVLNLLDSEKVKSGDYAELDKAVKPYFDELQGRIDRKERFIGPVKRRIRAMTTDGHLNGEGVNILQKWKREYQEDQKEKPYDVIDEMAFHNDTQKAIEQAGVDKFNDYLQKEFENLHEEKFLWDNGKKYKFNVDNIVKLMKKYRGTNNEGAGGMNYGFNSLLAYLSHRFTSISDIKSRESTLQPNAKELKQYKKAESMFDNLCKEAVKLKGNADESVYIDLAELIKDIRDGKENNLHGFPENKEFVKNINSFLKEADKVTTDYFEAKPARKVEFSEFSGAVVPNTLQKKTVDYLKSQGIEVVTYNPNIAGDRQAKTRDLGSELNVYFQSGGKYQGAYDPERNAIELFDGANQSTVIHEGAHMYLSILERMENLTEDDIRNYFGGDHEKAAASMQKVMNDLSTIREWAAYSDKHLEEYKGTSLEKEFTKHAEDIRNGVEGAEEVWMQERFARGFEKYLMDGSAPTKEMKGVFRRFKSWLTDIYKTAKSLGKVKLTPEIRGIYDHMIATDREIEAWAAQRKLDSIDKAMNVNETEAENFKRWSEEVKEKAKEVAMSFYMKTMKSDALENFRKSIDTEENRRDFEKKLAEENPLYMIEQLYNSGNQTAADKKALLKMNGLEEKDFLESVKAMGGTTKERWNRHIEEEVQNFQDNILTEQDVRSMAESVLESPEGLQKRSQIEAHLLEKRVNQYIAQVTSSQLKLKRAKDKAKVAMEIKERLGLISSEEKAEMGRQAERITRDEDKIQKLEERVKKLKDQLKEEKEKSEKAESRNKTSGEVIDRLNGNIKALQDELEKERAKSEEQKDTITDSEATVADLESQLNDMVEGLKESRKAMRIDYKLLKDDAAATLGEETVSHATSWKWWENKARIANVRSMKAMERNDFEEAAYQKQVETQDILMSRMAKENIDEIKHALHGGGKLTTAQYNEEGMDRYGILGILNRIGRKEKPVLMNDDARYFVQHLAYMAGITNRDGELPLDDKGLPREFDWKALDIDLNPDAAMGGPDLGKEVIAPWMKTLFESRAPKKMMDLKMNDLREIFKAIKAMYKIGRREYEGNSLGTSFDNAAAKIEDEIMTKWTHSKRPPLEKALQARTLDRAAEKFHKLVKDITLPEILIERMGEEFYQYVYVPIDKASAVRRQMKQDANKKIQNLLSTYSRKEWTTMRSKKDYTYGYDSTGQPYHWTKEQVLCMALNMGTESNRARLIETVGGNEAQMMDFLDQTLDKRDWDFVEGIWSHINEYWGERNKIQNDLYGTPMGKVPGLKIQLRNGRTIQGMYYPIKYDQKLAGITNERAANEIAAEDLQGISAFALGMGSTKSREKGSGGQLLRLDLDVYTSHISEAIQHVSMREATVDVYKLLNRKEVVSTLERTIGPEGLNMLRQWVSDNWHSSIIEMSEWNGTLNRLRHNYAFATMGYRVSTALLNVLNIFGMMDRMGPYNALKATADFYFGGGPNAFRNVRDQYRFITQKSTYMRERAANMDRDMALGDKIQVGQNESEIRSLITHGKYGIDKINSGAFKIMAWTDEMFSLPEWMATYKGTMRKLSLEGKLSQEEMNAEAVRLADKAVRETFGSGEVKDQTAFMRKGDWLTKMTSFFSYTNLVTNQFIRAGYEMYDHKNIKPLLTATLFWWLLNGFFEACLRELWDDSKDDDKWRKKLIYVMASGGPLGGVPVIREALPSAANYMAKGGKGQLQDLAPDVPALGGLTYLGKALQSYYKGDTLETGRNINKAVTRSTPFSLRDTIVDGYWNFLRLMSTDSHTLTEFIYKSAFDKELKEEGGKNDKHIR